MFRRIEDFRNCWRAEAETVLKVLDAIPDGALDSAVTEGHRSLRRMAWHLVESVIEMPGRWGIEVPGKGLIENGFIGAPPATMAEIRAAFVAASEGLEAGLESWNDATLEQEDDMYGDRWKRGFSLHILVVHQVHHRGQMTVLMRQAGLSVPDVYGPSMEGWGAYGMEAPAV